MNHKCWDVQDENAGLPDVGPAVERLRAPPMDRLPNDAAEAIAGLPDAFPIAARVGPRPMPPRSCSAERAPLSWKAA